MRRRRSACGFFGRSAAGQRIDRGDELLQARRVSVPAVLLERTPDDSGIAIGEDDQFLENLAILSAEEMHARS